MELHQIGGIGEALTKDKPNPKDDFDLANVDVYPWGLFVDDGVDERIYHSAMERFGQNYLGWDC